MDKSDIEKAEKIYSKSIEILERFQLKNGAILASSPKGRYPYIYPRDHSICILALIELNYTEKAKKALEFILKAQNKNGSFPQRLNKNGKDASYKPIQLDNTGLVLYVFAKYIKKTRDKTFLKKYRNKIIKSIEYILLQINDKKNLFFTPNSIHEFPPFEEGLEIWANSVCYGALKELEDIGIKSGIKIEKIKKDISKYFWNGKYFIKNIRVKESSSVAKEPDASAYSVAEFEVLRNNNKKIRETVKEIEKKLWHPKLGGICRYERHIGRNNGGWGPWPHFTLMICRYFIREGRKKQSDKYLKWILDISYNYELPEHIATRRDFENWIKIYKKAGIMRRDREIMIKNIKKSDKYKRGLAYSVIPLTWPHAEFIRTWNLYKKRFL
jgi:GH15 family glucan-1,4-alpha-glucosidase